jgi:protein phosphatase
VTAAGATDVGRVSDHDDDTTLVRPDLDLYLAADGAGGHNAGNVASALAAASIAEFIEMSAQHAASRAEIDEFGLHRDARRLAAAIQSANRRIMKAGAEDEARRGMGTTVVATLFSRSSGVFHLGYVGDSRCYRLRDGYLELLTFDHSLTHDVLELRPDMDDASLSRFPPNVLTRALGMEEGVRVSVRTHQVAPGDRYLLCSDGLTDAIEPEALGGLLGLARPPSAIVAALIDAANEAGGPDNISAVVIACDSEAAHDASTAGLPLPRPRRKRRAARVPTVVEDDDQPDLVIEDDGAAASEDEAPDLVIEDDASSADVNLVIDELFSADTRLGAAIDRASGRATTEDDASGRCVACTAAIDPDANFCGFCGAQQSATS